MTVSLQKIIDSNVFMGTLVNTANPKTREYRCATQNSMILMNPEMIQTQLHQAREKFLKAKAEKKEILVICEKALYADTLEGLAKDDGFHYLNYKVPSGVLTNFDTLMARIKSMNEMRSQIESENFQKYTKKEQSTKLRKIVKIEKVYKGVKNLKKRPDFVLIVDGTFMLKFVNELEKVKVDNIIVASSDFPKWWNEENLVMANVDSHQSLDCVLRYIIKGE